VNLEVGYEEKRGEYNILQANQEHVLRTVVKELFAILEVKTRSQVGSFCRLA